jgi:hypothetical protein
MAMMEESTSLGMEACIGSNATAQLWVSFMPLKSTTLNLITSTEASKTTELGLDLRGTRLHRDGTKTDNTDGR